MCLRYFCRVHYHITLALKSKNIFKILLILTVILYLIISLATISENNQFTNYIKVIELKIF